MKVLTVQRGQRGSQAQEVFRQLDCCCSVLCKNHNNISGDTKLISEGLLGRCWENLWDKIWGPIYSLDQQIIKPIEVNRVQ